MPYVTLEPHYLELIDSSAALRISAWKSVAFVLIKVESHPFNQMLLSASNPTYYSRY